MRPKLPLFNCVKKRFVACLQLVYFLSVSINF